LSNCAGFPISSRPAWSPTLSVNLSFSYPISITQHTVLGLVYCLVPSMLRHFLTESSAFHLYKCTNHLKTNNFQSFHTQTESHSRNYWTSQNLFCPVLLSVPACKNQPNESKGSFLEYPRLTWVTLEGRSNTSSSSSSSSISSVCVKQTVVDLVEIPTSTRHLKASRDGRRGWLSEANFISDARLHQQQNGISIAHRTYQITSLRIYISYHQNRLQFHVKSIIIMIYT